jgi:D-proline reductase (dithiol) PrdB
MKEKEEGRPPGLRRSIDDDHLRAEEDALPLPAQLMDTLREGYSWTRAFETRHPGWHLPAVEGFPFKLPARPVSDARICMISLAGVYRKGQKPFNTAPGPVPQALRLMRFRDRGDCSLRQIPVDCNPSELGIAHAHYDHSEADEDINCVFPLARLAELELEGFIGECAGEHYSMMGYVPEAKPMLQATERDLLPALRKQKIDAVVISGGCELSHYNAAIIQREIEAAGIPTVAVTLCRDITYHMQTPRAAALRFPLGNPFGSSMDAPMQTRILRDALSVLDSAKTPGEILDLPYDWVKV